MDDTHANLTHFMPSGKPAPAVLTSDEVVEFLRLEGKNPERTLKYWRDEGDLVGVRLGKRIRYRLEDVLYFVAQKDRKNITGSLTKTYIYGMVTGE